MHLPVSFKDDRRRAEQILLDVAPKVYWRITHSWLELTVRFVADTHGVREIKDRMSRHILQAFDEAESASPRPRMKSSGCRLLRIEDAR